MLPEPSNIQQNSVALSQNSRNYIKSLGSLKDFADLNQKSVDLRLTGPAGPVRPGRASMPSAAQPGEEGPGWPARQA